MTPEIPTRENYTRVTNVLYPFSGLQNIDAEVLQHAAERGTKVHKICEGIIEGLGEHGVDDECRPYVESFKLWWNLGHDVIAVENRFWDDQYHITGQVDLIIRTDNGLAILDLKTSSKPSKTWPVQGAAYAWLASNAGYDIKEILFLHLNRQGKAPKTHSYPLDTDLFMSCLRVYNHFYKGQNDG